MIQTNAILQMIHHYTMKQVHLNNSGLLTIFLALEMIYNKGKDQLSQMPLILENLTCS